MHFPSSRALASGQLMIWCRSSRHQSILSWTSPLLQSSRRLARRTTCIASSQPGLGTPLSCLSCHPSSLPLLDPRRTGVLPSSATLYFHSAAAPPRALALPRESTVSLDPCDPSASDGTEPPADVDELPEVDAIVSAYGFRVHTVFDCIHPLTDVRSSRTTTTTIATCPHYVMCIVSTATDRLSSLSHSPIAIPSRAQSRKTGSSRWTGGRRG